MDSLSPTRTMPKISFRKPLTVVLTLEGLATAPLGCYGCSWNATPAIDALAAGGVLWDRWIAGSDVPGQQIHDWLEGSRETIQTLRREGACVLLTDDAGLDPAEDGYGFDVVERLAITRHESPVESLEQSAVSATFAAAIDRLDDDVSLMWLHSGLLRDAWDVPRAPEEPPEAAEPEEETWTTPSDTRDDSLQPFELPSTTAPPTLQRSPGDHPDLLFRWMQRYGEVVAAFDEMIQVFVDATARRKTTFVIAGTSGFALGENGWLGHHVGPLRSCDVRLPMIVSRGGPLRVPAVVSATHWPDVLRRIAEQEHLVTPEDWCQAESSIEPRVDTQSDRAAAAVTTPSWFYVREADGPGEETLFLKPDDLCDANDVSRLRRDVVDELSED